METTTILEQLENRSLELPRAALEEAGARKEEIVPELLRILEDTIERADELAPDGKYMAHFYAMYLLAQFREPRAYPLVARFGRLPSDTLEDLAGDFIADDFGRVLASVCGGDVSEIESLIENERVDEWIRGSCLNALNALVAVGQKSREDVVVYFRELFEGKLERNGSPVWDALVNCSADLWPLELMVEIERAYREGLVDTRAVRVDDVRDALTEGKDRMLARLTENGRRALVENAAEEMEGWDCFQDELVDLSSEAFVETYRREGPKIGRNDPCPCGSGKKYKKCCGA